MTAMAVARLVGTLRFVVEQELGGGRCQHQRPKIT